MKKRINELDFIKGIAMLLVVIGHVISQVWNSEPSVYENNPVFLFCYSFHMPLFVFISGYICRLTIKTEYNWLRRRIRQIAVPYLLSLVLWYVILKRNSFSDFLSPMAYWYLPFILIADTAFFFENKFHLHYFLFGAVLVSSLLICRFESTQIDLAHQLLHCLIFYIAGTLAPEIKKICGEKLLLIYCIFTAFFLLLIPFYAQGTEAQLNSLPKFLADSADSNFAVRSAVVAANKFIVPTCGICLVLLLTNLAYRFRAAALLRRIPEFIGRHTLFIYILHDLFFISPTDIPLLNCIISLIISILVPALLSVLFGKIKLFLHEKNPLIRMK